jgi:hypothetical protein
MLFQEFFIAFLNNQGKPQEPKHSSDKDSKSNIANYTHSAKIAISDKERNIT